MFIRNGSLLIFVGVGLMAICGSRLSDVIGLTLGQYWILPGFAVGIALLGQAPAAFLQRRIEKLERQVGNT